MFQNEKKKIKIINSVSEDSTKKNRVVVSIEIDSLLNKIIDNLMDHYVMSWYSSLVDNGDGKHHLSAKDSVNHLRSVLRF